MKHVHTRKWRDRMHVVKEIIWWDDVIFLEWVKKKKEMVKPGITGIKFVYTSPCTLYTLMYDMHMKGYWKINYLFRYVKDPMMEGDVFGSKDFFTGLGVIADTYSNHNGPHNVRRSFFLLLLIVHSAILLENWNEKTVIWFWSCCFDFLIKFVASCKHDCSVFHYSICVIHSMTFSKGRSLCSLVHAFVVKRLKKKGFTILIP